MTTFSDLGLPEDVVSALAMRRIVDAFPIQAMAIPPALEGRDVCGRAPTGSGKTLAFGIPLASRVGRAKVARPKALVLAPTRELAEQIHDELRLLLKPYKRTVMSFYGGVGFGPQLKALRRGVDVAVACPGRLADLVNRGNLQLGDVEIAVIDEADRMADMGFLPEVKRILDQVKPDRQTLLFSATLDGDVDELIRRYQRNPERCDVMPDESLDDTTSHHFVRVRRDERIKTTADIVNAHGSTVVFSRTKHGADRLAKQLKREGVKAVPIHGGRSQGQRKRALAAFSEGQATALVATDVAARGIHVDDVRCVVHFDVPQDHKDYVHRSGRTGRAGADGVVVSFVTDADVAKVKKMRRKLDLTRSSDSHPDAPSDRPPAANAARRPPRETDNEPRADLPERGSRAQGDDDARPKKRGSGPRPDKNKGRPKRKRHSANAAAGARHGSKPGARHAKSGKPGAGSGAKSGGAKPGGPRSASSKPGGSNPGARKSGGRGKPRSSKSGVSSGGRPGPRSQKPAASRR